MGGHGGLNILPQKSWNVYGQRNRQKVAEDEAADREKKEKEREQQTRGDRVARVNVLRNQVPAEELRETSPDKPPEQLRHINFWSDHEAASRNPEAEAEKADQQRKRGDPKTQTSDARFDARFAVLHGHTGQAPWYARRSATIYSEDTAGIDHSRSAALASVRTLLDRSQAPRPNGAQSSRPGSANPSQRGLLKPRATSGGQHAASRSADRSAAHPAQPQSQAHPAAADPAPDRAALDTQPQPVGAARTHSRSRSPHHRRSSHSGAHKHDKKAKKRKRHSRDKSRARSRSRSPKLHAERPSSKIRHDASRRRNRSPSGSGSDDGGGGKAAAGRGAAGGRGAADGFEALRQERLERERLEAARSRQLMRDHFRSS